MKRNVMLMLVAAVFAVPAVSYAAIGCTLRNPARDLKTLYPDMTSYREDVQEMPKHPDGKEMYAMYKTRSGGELDPIYEAYDTPHTFYTVFKNDARIGFVHGINVPGRGGVIQIFMSMNPETAAIEKLFFQQLVSPGGKALRAKAVREQFAGLSLADFYKHDYYVAADPANAADKIAALKPPEDLPEAAKPDWDATLRGVRKNLLLFDFFVFDRRHEPFHERAEAAKKSKGKE